MKKFLLLVTLFCALCGTAKAVEVVVGDEESTGTQYTLPVNMFYNYSLTQQIFTAQEIGMAGTITSISFYYNVATAFSMNNIQVFMVNTTKEAFASNTDLEAITEGDKVFEGTFSADGAGWAEIILDAPFVYDGTSNLLVAVFDPQSGYPGSSCKFKTTATTENLGVAYYSDSSTPSLADLSTYGGSKSVYKYRVNTKLDITGGAVQICERPTDLVISNITTTSADLAWQGHAAEYKVSYISAEGGVVSSIETSASKALTGLTPGTAYAVQVSAICAAGDTSRVLSGSFSTACQAITSFPWSENFDELPAGDLNKTCWVNEHIAGTAAYVYKVYTSTSGMGGNTSKMLQLPDMNVGNQVKLVLPEVSIPTGSPYQFSLDVYRSNSYPTKTGEGIRIFASADGNLEGATELAFIPRVFSVGNDTIPAEAVGNAWYNYELTIPMVGTCYIIIRGESQYGTSTYMDNFVIREAPACIKPSALAVSEVKSHTAKLSWNPGAEEDAWQIMLNDDEEHLINADTNVFVLTGLPADSQFVAKVRSNCGAAQSEWANTSVTFTTLVACPAPVFSADSIKNILAHSADLTWGGESAGYIVSYRTPAGVSGMFEGFEDADEFAANWVPVAIVETNMGSRFGRLTSAKYEGDYGFSFSSYSSASDYNQYLISPELNGATLLKFYYKRSGYSEETFAVGYSSTNSAIADFVWGDTITANTSNWAQYIDTIPAGTKFVAINYFSTYKYDLYIDNIEIGSEIPASEWTVQSGITGNSVQLTGLAAETKYEVKVQADCGEEGTSLIVPGIFFSTVSDCQCPNDLEADSLTTTSAVLTWNTYGLTNFNLRYGTDGENWTNVAGVTMPYKLTGLTAGTEYKVQVQATCNPEDWSAVATFKTVYAIPYAPVAIEASEWWAKSGFAADVFAGQDFLSNSSTWSIAGANEAFDAAHLKINNYGTSRKDWALSPVIDATGLQLAAGEKLKLSFTVALAKWSSGGSVATLPDTTGVDDKFIVAFSIDNGETWLAANATEWSNAEGAANIYNYIPNTGMEVSLDFSAAAGHVMRFAFYAESTISNADNDIHVGNIVLDVVTNTTDIQSVEATDMAIKFIKNGHIYILRDGVIYDAVGRLINK